MKTEESPERFKICKGCTRILDSLAEIHYKDTKVEKSFFCAECGILLNGTEKASIEVVQNEALLVRQQRFNFEKQSLNKLNASADRAPKGCVWICAACSRMGIFKSRVQFLCGALSDEHEPYIQLAYAYSIVYDQNNRIIEYGKYSRKDN